MRHRIIIGISVVLALSAFIFIPVRRDSEITVLPQMSMVDDIQIGLSRQNGNLRLVVNAFTDNPPRCDLNDPLVLACNWLPPSWLVRLKHDQLALLKDGNYGMERLASYKKHDKNGDTLMANANLPNVAAVLLVEGHNIIGCHGSSSFSTLLGIRYYGPSEYSLLNQPIELGYNNSFKGVVQNVVVPDGYRYYLLSDDPSRSCFTPERAMSWQGWRFFFLVRNPF